MSRSPYTYSILRYRHDPVAGEQVNIGVALYCGERRFVGFKVKKAMGRLKRVFPDIDSAALRNDLARIETAFEVAANVEEAPNLFKEVSDVMSIARSVVPVDDGALQWSPIASGVSSDICKTLSDLYSRFIAQYDRPDEHKRPDADVWRPFRDRLLERNIAHIFDKKTIASPRVQVEFEHAWKNGVWHCFQPLSFDLSTPDGIQDKAARWVGQMVGLAKADENFETYFLVGPPSDVGMLPAYNRAIDFLKESTRAYVVLESDVDNLANQLEDKVRHSQDVL